MCTLGALAYLDGSKVGYDSVLAGCKKMASRPGTIDASKAFCKKQKVNENFCSSCRTCANVTASDPRVQIRATDSGRQSAQSTQRRPLHGVAAERGPHAASVPQFFENMHVHIISTCASTFSPTECVPSKVSRAHCATVDPGFITSLPTSMFCNCLLPSHRLRASSLTTRSSVEKQKRVLRAGADA